jgi:hypothetical protein
MSIILNMKSYSLYFITDNGNIYSSALLAKRVKDNPEKIVEVVRVFSKTGLDKLKSRGTIYRGPACGDNRAT